MRCARCKNTIEWVDHGNTPIPNWWSKDISSSKMVQNGYFCDGIFNINPKRNKIHIPFKFKTYKDLCTKK
jgi:hypothetical protein